MKKVEHAKLAAEELVRVHFPHCEAAILAGSIVRGEATKTSDLDIVIFESSVPNSYRESFYYKSWPVEWYVHNLESYQSIYESDCKRGRPSMPRMVEEGIVIVDTGICKDLKSEAKHILEAGPDKWDEATIRLKRYFLTDALDDYIGTNERGEEMCCAIALADQVHEFILRVNGQWTGSSKWIIRALRNYDPEIAIEFESVFDDYFTKRKKEGVVHFVERELAPYGGRFFEGFSLGKK